MIRRAAAVVMIVFLAFLGTACQNDSDDENPDGQGEPQESPTSLPDTQETNPPLTTAP